MAGTDVLALSANCWVHFPSSQLIHAASCLVHLTTYRRLGPGSDGPAGLAPIGFDTDDNPHCPAGARTAARGRLLSGVPAWCSSSKPGNAGLASRDGVPDRISAKITRSECVLSAVFRAML